MSLDKHPGTKQRSTAESEMQLISEVCYICQQKELFSKLKHLAPGF